MVCLNICWLSVLGTRDMGSVLLWTQKLEGMLPVHRALLREAGSPVVATPQ
jgi:hypothetical protein